MEALRGSTLAQRVRYALLGLEDRDLEQQAAWGLRSLIGQARTGKALRCVVKDLLTGLENASVSARRHRYLLAGHAVDCCPSDVVQTVVPFVMKQVNCRLGEEKHQSTVLAAGQLVEHAVERVMGHMVEVLNGEAEESAEFSNGWLSNTLIQGLVKTAARSPDRNRVAMAFSMLHGVVSALRDWTHVPGVVPTVLFCFEHTVRAMQPGSLACQVPGAYLPAQRCMEILGIHAPAATVNSAVKVCILGARHRDDWQVRRSAMDTLTVIAAAVQFHEQAEGGAWVLKLSEGLQVLIQQKPEIMKVLKNAKYDKTLNVRKAAAAAKSEMDNIPDPVPENGKTCARSGPGRSGRQQSSSFDGHPVSGKSAMMRSRSCEVPGMVSPRLTSRVQRSRYNCRSVDIRRPMQSTHKRSVSGIQESPPVLMDRSKKETAPEKCDKQRRAHERRASVEDFRSQLRRARSAKGFSKGDGHDFEIQVFTPARASNHFDMSDMEGNQRCPSAPLLTPRQGQDAELPPVLANVPTSSKLALRHVEGHPQEAGGDRLAAWVSGVQASHQLQVDMAPEGEIGHHAHPGMDERSRADVLAHAGHRECSLQQSGKVHVTGNMGLDGGGTKSDEQRSDTSISLLPPAIMRGLPESGIVSVKKRQIAEEKASGSDISGACSSHCHKSTMSVVAKVSNGGGLEPTSPAVSTGSIPPLVAVDNASLNPVDSVGEYHENGLKGKVPGPVHPPADAEHQEEPDEEVGNKTDVDLVAVHEELSQLRQSLDNVVSRVGQEVDHHQTSKLIEHARSVMAALTRGAKYDPSVVPPELLTSPCQEPASDRGDNHALRTSPARMGSREALNETVVRENQEVGKRADCKKPSPKGEPSGVRQHYQKPGAHPSQKQMAKHSTVQHEGSSDRTDTAEKLDDLDSMSESSVHLESSGRKRRQWRSVKSSRGDNRPCASPEQLLNYTIATLRKCMEDLPVETQERGQQGRSYSDPVVYEAWQPAPYSVAESRFRQSYPGETQLSAIKPISTSAVAAREPEACGQSPTVPPLVSLENEAAQHRLQIQSSQESASTDCSRVPGALSAAQVTGIPPCVHSSLVEAARDHADGVEQYYRTREQIQLQFLEEQYKRSVANMQAMFEKEKAFLRNATQHAIKEEVNLFSQTYLPHVASIVSSGSHAEADTEGLPRGVGTRSGTVRMC